MSDSTGREPWNDPYLDVQEALDVFDEERQGVMLTRLAVKLNDGSEHFGHSDRGMFYLCLACVRAGYESLLARHREAGCELAPTHRETSK